MFYYPSKNIGGAQFLILRLSEWIVKNSDFKVCVCDYADGFIASSLTKNTAISIIPFNGNKVHIPVNSYLVLFANFVFRMNDYFSFDNSNRIFYWSVHPYNIISNFRFFSSFYLFDSQKRRIAEGLSKLICKDSLYFMDEPNLKVNEVFFGNKFAIKDYMQILVPKSNSLQSLQFKKKNENYIRIAWLGRLDSDKINSVKMLFREVNALPNKDDIIIDIIGNGKLEQDVKRYVSNIPIRVEFKGKMQGIELSDYIRAYVDIGFAMGTSSLEFAMNGTPVIAADVYKKMYNAGEIKYDLLYEMNGYSVGDIYRDGIQRHRNFPAILNYINCNYQYCAKKYYDYVQSNFIIDAVAPKFLRMLQAQKEEDRKDVFQVLEELNEVYSGTIYSKAARLKGMIKKYINILSSF